MKKALFVLLALIAVPAMAANVVITGAVSGSSLTIGYDATATGQLPSAFGLDLQFSGTATLASAVAAPGNMFTIYPGSIVITNGVVTGNGDPVAAATALGNPLSDTTTPKGRTIEMGALYARPNGTGKPGTTGNLIVLTFTGTGSVTVTPVANAARGGVVLEDASVATITTSGSWTVDTVPPAPAAPTNVAATDGTGATTITVTWTASSGATSYDVYKSLTNNSATATLIGTGGQTSPFVYTVASSGVPAGALTQMNAEGKTHYFWVKAKNAGGASAFSTGDAGYITEFMKATTTPAAVRTDWVNWGRPNCWGYQRQCRGDINGLAGLGTKWVNAADLTAFKAAYDKTESDLRAIPNGICADLNKAVALGGKRVSAADLTEFKKYYDKAVADVPVCPQTNYNFWKN